MMKNSTLSVSIIIPTFNRINFLKEAIKSVINQTYANWECIVVDDASTDETEDFMSGVVNDRIKYIRHSTNKGGADARNTGIENSTGEYVAFLDSDDIWLPEKLEIQINHILQHQDCLDKIVSYTAVKLSENNQLLPKREKKENEFVAEYLFLGKSGEGLILTSSLIISRSILLKTKFTSGLKKHHDLDLVIRLEKNGAIFKYLNIPLTIWRNDSRYDRLSLDKNYQTSLDWVFQNKDLISRQAKFGFLYRWVFRKLIVSGEQRIFAEWILINNIYYLNISLFRYLKDLILINYFYLRKLFGQ